jgi:hypothetical protein
MAIAKSKEVGQRARWRDISIDVIAPLSAMVLARRTRTASQRGR